MGCSLEGSGRGLLSPGWSRKASPSRWHFYRHLRWRWRRWEQLGGGGWRLRVLEADKEGESRIPGFGAPEVSGGSWLDPGTSISHPGEELGGRGGRGKRRGQPFPRPPRQGAASVMRRARPLAAALGTERRPRPGHPPPRRQAWRGGRASHLALLHPSS